ncbi:MAG: DMT family transporter [Bacillota bacterium]
MQLKNETLVMLAGIVAATIFGFSFLFTKEVLEFITPFHLLGLRFGLAAIVLSLLNLLNVIEVEYRTKKWRILLLVSLFQPILYSGCETVGINLTSSSEAGLVIALVPIFATIVGALFLDERPTKKQVIFTLISVVGVILIIVMKSQLEVQGDIVGIFVLLGAGLSAGFYNMFSKLSSADFKPIEVTYVMMWAGAIVFNGIALVQHLRQDRLAYYFQPLSRFDVLAAVIYLGILASIITFLLFNYMLSRIEAGRTAVFTNLTTVISVIGGVVVRGEPFYWFHILGGCMILVGVWGTNYYQRSQQPTSSKVYDLPRR